MRLRWLMLLAAPVAALALLGAACGGDDDDGAGDDGDAATATADAGDDGDDAADGETPEPADEGDDDDGASAGAVDACSLITRDEAEAALGTSVGEGQREDVPPIFSCRYETEGFDFVSVSAIVYDDEDQAEAGYELAIDINDYEEIEGIGDRAYFALGFGVTALKDKYEVTVGVVGPDDGRELEEDLARSAVGRLP